MSPTDLPPTRIDLTTQDGTLDCYALHPPTSGGASWPAVILYMDAFGINEGLLSMARTFAEQGYYVLVPNLFYRAGNYAPFDQSAFAPGPERDRMMALVFSINRELVMRDTAACLDFLRGQALVAGEKIGCVGYCLGGPFALSAAGTFPDRVVAAASIHGGRLATDKPDSPHLLAPQMRARLHIAVAEGDLAAIGEENTRLADALTAAGVAHTLEVYPGTRHGFAVRGRPVFDQAASDRHFQRVLALFGETLKTPA